MSAGDPAVSVALASSLGITLSPVGHLMCANKYGMQMSVRSPLLDDVIKQVREWASFGVRSGVRGKLLLRSIVC